MLNFDEVCQHFRIDRQGSDTAQAFCPVHAGGAEKVASLTLTRGDDGRTLIFCHVCGKEGTAEILKAVGLNFSDVTPVREYRRGKTVKEFAEWPGKKGEFKGARFVESYDYGNGQGYSYTKARIALPDGGKSFRYCKTGQNGLVAEFKVKDRGNYAALFPYSEIIAARQTGDQLLFCEGEKDVKNAIKAGLHAVTAGSVNDWTAGHAVHFDGLNVVIIPDNDKPGFDLARRVMHDLEGVAACVRVVHWPDGFQRKGDYSDFLETHSLDDFRVLLENAVSPAEFASIKPPAEPQQETPADRIRAIIANPSAEIILTKETGAALVAIEHAEPALFHHFREACRSLKISLRQVDAMVRDAKQEAARAKGLERQQAEQEREELTFASILPGVPEGLRVPPNYCISKDGRITHLTYVQGPVGLEEQFTDVTATCIIPVEYIDNRDTGDLTKKIAIWQGQNWRIVSIVAEILASKSRILQLANQSLDVTTDTASEVIGFIRETENFNRGSGSIPRSIAYSHTGWHGDKFVLPGRGAYIVDSGDEDMVEAYTVKGTAEEWEALAARAFHYFIVRVAIAGSLAAPLLRDSDARGLVISEWGDSEHGKTSAAYIAASIWGNPHKLLLSADTTPSAAEYRAANNCDLPIFFDDTQKFRNKEGKTLNRAELAGFIYKFADGQGRQRATRNGGRRKTLSWRTVSFFSGEHSITDETTDAGEHNRIIEFCVSDLPKMETELAASLHHMRTWGHLGRQALNYIENRENGPTLDKLLQEITEGLQSEYSTHTGGQVMNCRTLALGFGLWFLLHGSTEQEAVQQALDFARELLAKITTALEIDEGKRAERWLDSWIAENIHHFDRDLPAIDVQGVPAFDGETPRMETIRATANPVYGFTPDNGQTWLINAGSFKAAAEAAGYSARKIIPKLADRGRIISRTGDRFTEKAQRYGARANYYRMISQ